MARLSYKPAFGAKNPPETTEKKEPKSVSPDVIKEKLLTQNSVLAMKNEQLMRQIGQLENKLTHAQKEVIVSRHHEAELKKNLSRSIDSIRDTIDRNLGNLMAEFDERVTQLGLDVPVKRIGYEKRKSMRLLEDKGGVKDDNISTIPEEPEEPEEDKEDEDKEHTNTNNDETSVSIIPTDTIDTSVPEYKELPEDVPQKKEPVKLPPVGQLVKVPSLKCDEDKLIDQGTDDHTVELQEEEPKKAPMKDESNTPTSDETTADNMMDQDIDDIGEPLDNPFDEPKKEEKPKKHRKRLSGLPRELKNLSFPVPLYWKKDENKSDGKDDDKSDKDTSIKDTTDTSISDKDLLDDTLDKDTEDIDLILMRTQRRLSSGTYNPKKRKNVVQYGSRKKANKGVLSDVTNKQRKSITGKKNKNEINVDDSESNKENRAPGRQISKKKSKGRRRRKYRHKTVVSL